MSDQIKDMAEDLFKLNKLEDWVLEIREGGDGLTQHDIKRIIVGRGGGIGLLCHEIAHAMLPRNEKHSGLHADKAHMVFNQALSHAQKESRIDEAIKALHTMLLKDRKTMGKRQRRRIAELKKEP